MIPTTSADFDRAYALPFTLWGDLRVPPEVTALAYEPGRRILELGCGVGRFSRVLANAGAWVTAVDFSPVAISKARARVRDDRARPDFRVADVTKLEGLDGPFDASFDVGCFHCLEGDRARAYADQVARVLKPGGVHLMWAIDESPANYAISAASVRSVFEGAFEMIAAKKSRRRVVASHWYWLAKK